MSDRFNDIGRHEHLEAEQERSTDADLIEVGVLLRYRLPQLAIGRPYDTDHDDENAEDFDPAPDDADEVVDRRFEALDRVLHLRASHRSRRASLSSRSAPAIVPEPGQACSLLLPRHGITGQLCPVWHQADMPEHQSNVRFRGQSRHLMLRSSFSAFDPKRT